MQRTRVKTSNFDYNRMLNLHSAVDIICSCLGLMSLCFSRRYNIIVGSLFFSLQILNTLCMTSQQVWSNRPSTELWQNAEITIWFRSILMNKDTNVIKKWVNNRQVKHSKRKKNRTGPAYALFIWIDEMNFDFVYKNIKIEINWTFKHVEKCHSCEYHS